MDGNGKTAKREWIRNQKPATAQLSATLATFALLNYYLFVTFAQSK